MLTADRVDACRTRGEAARAQTVERRHGLLADRPNRHPIDLVVPGGFQQRLRVGPIGFAAVPIAAHVSRGQRGYILRSSTYYRLWWPTLLLRAANAFDHRGVGHGIHSHSLFEEPIEEFPAMG